jgi:hypothetical protein
VQYNLISCRPIKSQFSSFDNRDIATLDSRARRWSSLVQARLNRVLSRSHPLSLSHSHPALPEPAWHFAHPSQIPDSFSAPSLRRSSSASLPEHFVSQDQSRSRYMRLINGMSVKIVRGVKRNDVPKTTAIVATAMLVIIS